MISSLRGPLLHVAAGFVIVELGGFGMRVEVPNGTRSPSAHRGEEIFFHTTLVVREDSLTLFGFETREELDVFDKLRSVSGVGPRSALGVLSELTPAEVAIAVSREDEKPFRKVSGIGPKTAKLIAVSLSGKLEHLLRSDEPLAKADVPNALQHAIDQVVAGLVGLGWSEPEALQAVKDATVAGAGSESAALMRASLALLQAPRPRSESR